MSENTDDGVPLHPVKADDHPALQVAGKVWGVINPTSSHVGTVLYFATLFHETPIWLVKLQPIFLVCVGVFVAYWINRLLLLRPVKQERDKLRDERKKVWDVFQKIYLEDQDKLKTNDHVRQMAYDRLKRMIVCQKKCEWDEYSKMLLSAESWVFHMRELKPEDLVGDADEEKLKWFDANGSLRV